MSSIFRFRSNPFFTIFNYRMLFTNPSLNFLATGLVSIVFFMVSSDMEKSLRENFSFAENFAFLYLFSLNFAFICYKKKMQKYRENLRQFSFFLEISLSCLNFAFLRSRIIRISFLTTSKTLNFTLMAAFFTVFWLLL